MTRQYVRLPEDAELVALWNANGQDFETVAGVLGCTKAAVHYRLKRLGMTRTMTRGTLAGLLTSMEATIAALTERIEALESRPTGSVRIVEWRPDHRRQADGGRPVRAQRREVGLPKRPQAVPA